MKNLGGAGSPLVAEHSHEEIWNLAPGLNPQLEQLAHDLLPAMKRYKRLIIRIGAAGLTGGSLMGVEALAQELADVCSSSALLVTNRYEGALGEGLIGQIVRETKILGHHASAIASFGVDGDSARSLRLAYRALRNSCAGLWLFEFAPEGRPQFLRGRS